MKKLLLIFFLLAISCISSTKKTTESTYAKKDKNKIKVLYLTGGSYHHYLEQERILKNTLLKSIKNITVDSFWLTSKKQYFRGNAPNLIIPKNDLSKYDIFIFNMCFAKTKNKKFASAIKKLIKDKPNLLIHCTFHTFWDIPNRSQWVHTLGTDSKKHNPRNKLQIFNSHKKHPITNFMNKEFFFTNSRDELYINRWQPKDIKVLFKGNDYKKTKQQNIAWEIKRDNQHSIAITIPHSHPEMETTYFQAFLVNSILYLANKPLPYYQHFTQHHKIFRRPDDKLFTYSKPNKPLRNYQAKTPSNISYAVPKKAKFFVAKFLSQKNTKSNGIFFKVFLNGKFLFHTADLYKGQEENIKIKLPPNTKTIDIKIGSYSYFYNVKRKLFFPFKIYDVGFIL